MAPRTAYQVIHDELRLDGFSLLNLATFVTTWMEPEAKQLIGETLDKNMIDKDEYPQTAEIEKRCVNILADLWHAPGGEGVGTSTIGSSEACMLGGMAMKWRWRDRQRAAGRPTDKPNLVMGANTQGGTVVVETLAQYSALMVMEEKYGPQVMRRFLQYELDNYLSNRGSEAVAEMPLMRVENQGNIHSRQGSLAMYALYSSWSSRPRKILRSISW